VALVLWRLVVAPAKPRDLPRADAAPSRVDAALPPDQGRVDLAPDAQLAPPRMTLIEMERLLEWAKRAAEGQRYTRPRGDNVQELLERVSHDYPGHPRVLAFREWLTARLAQRASLARRQGREAVAEATCRAWIALEPQATAPRVGLAGSLARQGQRALARRRFKIARKLALEAQELDRESAAPEALLGDLAAAQQRHAVAATHYKEALERQGLSRAQKRALAAKLARARKRAR
jgi:tetratricopeptide (TPR) repeat protein